MINEYVGSIDVVYKSLRHNWYIFSRKIVIFIHFTISYCTIILIPHVSVYLNLCLHVECKVPDQKKNCSNIWKPLNAYPHNWLIILAQNNSNKINNDGLAIIVFEYKLDFDYLYSVPISRQNTVLLSLPNRPIKMYQIHIW